MEDESPSMNTRNFCHFGCRGMYFPIAATLSQGVKLEFAPAIYSCTSLLELENIERESYRVFRKDHCFRPVSPSATLGI